MELIINAKNSSIESVSVAILIFTDHSCSAHASVNINVFL